MKAALSANVRDAYADGFARVLASSAHLPPWLNSARRNAFDAFVELGWPTTKQEDWRFTDIEPITQLAVQPLAQETAGQITDTFDESLLNLGHGQGCRLVFVDGRYRPSFSSWQTLPAGLVVTSLSSALSGRYGEEESDSSDRAVASILGQHLRDQNAFVALNTAFMSDGAFVRIPPGFTATQPIYLVFLASTEGTMSFPRTVVWAGEGSQATVVEVHLGAAGKATLANAATEILLEPRATLSHHSIQQTSAAGFHIGHLAVTQKAGSVLSAHSLVLDGRIVRNDVTALLAEEGAVCNLDGLYLAAGTGHVDNHTTIDHRAPRSTSRETYKGVVDEHGRAVFSGRIVVRPGAQQTDARQTNRNIILADGARVHSKPHLEIFANDVKCSHGATTGRLDPEALFYLRSRGLGKQEAHKLLIRAFMVEGLKGIANQPLRAELEAVVTKRIEDLAGSGVAP
jgi:Fe-S cluster assembly protein SufD